MKTKLHATAASIAFLMIFSFFSATIIAELFGSHDSIAMVKQLIFWGMGILAPAIAITGITGNLLGKTRKGPLFSRKKGRMPFIVTNGLVIMTPCAFYLNSLAAVETFNDTFYWIQALELMASVICLISMFKNLKDGLRLTGKLKAINSASTVISR